MNSKSDKGDNSTSAHVSECSNCHALMPHEMRFCRACGSRLGEGVEEYTETVRFGGAPNTSRRAKSRTAFASGLTSGIDSKEFRGMANQIHGKTVATGLGRFRIGRACKRVPRWTIWVIVPILIASMTGGFMSDSSSRRRSRNSVSASVPGSFLGGRYKTVDGGAFLLNASPPGSAADKAGLMGGDLIISMDGKPITSESDLTNLLRAMPIGKTVDVTYIRDGETKTTKLTTVSERENDRLAEVFNDRPEGKGFLGIGDDFRRVQVPGAAIHGVQLDDVHKNRPGYIAGLRAGDIVIEFDKVPIRTREEFNTRIDRALPDSTVKIVVMRGGERLEIPVKMGEE